MVPEKSSSLANCDPLLPTKSLVAVHNGTASALPASVKVEFNGEAPVLTPTCPFDSTMIESTIVLASLNLAIWLAVPPVVVTAVGETRVGEDSSRTAFEETSELVFV